MADLHVAFVLEALAELEREIVSTLVVVDSFDAKGAAPAVVVTFASLRSVLVLASSKIDLLRERVLHSVEVEAVAETREAALRARSNVVLLQLANLKSLEHDVSSSERAWLYVGRFVSLLHVIVFLVDRISSINAGWMNQKRAQRPTDADPTMTACRALYRIALENAEAAFSLIGQDADLARFLRAGASMRHPRFRNACREIAAIVGVTLYPDLET